MDSNVQNEIVLNNPGKLKPYKIARVGRYRHFKKYRIKSRGETQASIYVDERKTTPDTDFGISTSANGGTEKSNRETTVDSRPSLLPIRDSVNIQIPSSSSTVTSDTEKNSANECQPQTEVKIKYISQSDPTVQSIVHIESTVYNKKSKEDSKSPEKKQTPQDSTINSYACHLCKYTIEKLFNFRLHLAQHPVDPERLIPVTARQCQLKCGICGYFGTSKEDLALHVEEHAFQKRFLCGYCKKDFLKRRHILRHAAKRHKSDELCFYDRRILYEKLLKLPDWMVRMNPEVLLDCEEVSNYLEQQKLD